MEKVELRTADIAAENAAKLAELFPDIVTEVLDEDGSVRHSIDVEALKAHVGDVAEDKRERYQFTWPGKQKARAEAIRPIDKTMRPCVDESVNWDTTENLYIEGDNLDALKILRETYAGKIKMIYIDPPYNTGHDFVYNDTFAHTAEEERAESGAFDEDGNVLDAAYKVNNESNGKFHSDWCSMMYPRLVLARDLLSEDGIIFVSIDEIEYVDLVKICDDIFGLPHHIGTFQWKRRQNPDSRNTNRLSSDNEYIAVYARSFEATLNGVAIDESKYKKPDDDPRGPWASIDLSGLANASQRPNLHFDIVNPSTGVVYPPNPKRGWSKSRETISRMIEEDRILWPSSPNGRPREKKFISDLASLRTSASTWLDSKSVGFTTNGTRELSSIFEGKLFDFPKPVELLLFLVGQASDSDSVVLDFFSGSATTAHAVMQLNAEDGGRRKFIMVQLPEVCDEKSEAAKAGYKNICEIGKERIRRAGAKIAAEAEESNAQLKLGEEPKRVPDIGFRVLKIDSSNFEDVSRTPDTLFQDALFSLADNVKPGRTPEDILFQLFPKLEIPYTAHIDTFDICGKTVYSVDDDTLVACFDREVPEDVVRAMAQHEPAWAVLRDASFTGDDALANFEEIFKTLSPETKTRVV